MAPPSPPPQPRRGGGGRTAAVAIVATVAAAAAALVLLERSTLTLSSAPLSLGTLRALLKKPDGWRSVGFEVFWEDDDAGGDGDDDAANGTAELLEAQAVRAFLVEANLTGGRNDTAADDDEDGGGGDGDGDDDASPPPLPRDRKSVV